MLRTKYPVSLCTMDIFVLHVSLRSCDILMGAKSLQAEDMQSCCTFTAHRIS